VLAHSSSLKHTTDDFYNSIGANSINLLNTSFSIEILHDISSDINILKSYLYLPIKSGIYELPILHHLLNHYFKSQNPVIRRGLIDLMIEIINIENSNKHLFDSSRSLSDDNFNNDPSILFKTLLLREMRLSYLVINSSSLLGVDIVDSKIWNQLYSIPCEPVPIAKLLLYADKISRNKYHIDNVIEKDIKEMKDLISNSYLHGQKPSVNGRDLLHISSRYEDIIKSLIENHVLNEKNEFSISLTDINQMLSEVSSVIHKELLNKILNGDNGLLKLAQYLTTVDPINNRCALHLLAKSGSDMLIVDLVNVFNSNRNSESFLIATQLVFNSLLLSDNFGNSPIQYSYIRYGKLSPIYKAVRDLYEVVGATDSILHNEFMKDVDMDISMKQNNVFNEEDSCIDNIKEQTPINYGGWDSSSLLDVNIENIHNFSFINTDICDIKVLTGSLPSIEEFYINYINKGKPVILRGMVNGNDSFEKISFIKKYGNIQVPISSIPYGGSFGESVTMTTMEEMVTSSSIQLSQKYIFTTPRDNWEEMLRNDSPQPKIIPPAIQTEVQFYLGPVGSGAPVHFHGHAINSLAYGEKQW
jgi:hypothetical protein